MGIYDFVVNDIKGNEISFEKYKNKTLLIVNTASKCGFTPQFEGLEQLYQKYKDNNFLILGFPCNQFKNQDPHDNDNIEQFCKLNYGVTFPMFEKIEVNGENQSPLYMYLKTQQKGYINDEIKWNFTKFLVDKNGNVVKRYSPTIKPIKIENDIKKYI